MAANKWDKDLSCVILAGCSVLDINAWRVPAKCAGGVAPDGRVCYNYLHCLRSESLCMQRRAFIVSVLAFLVLLSMKTAKG